MNRLTCLTLIIALVVFQGCAGAPPTSRAVTPSAAISGEPGRNRLGDTMKLTPVAHITEVPVEKNAPAMPGHPLTSVVVTQCNLIVAVYMTMPDGRLLRFDRSASIPSEQLMTMAYSATRSERVEVSCNDAGVEGYEKHEPV